jgi:alpha-L-fucosidase 2
MANSSSPHVLWYQQPANDWFASSPLGNGRLGACVFGGLGTERLNLNEETLWSGGPRDTTNPEALENLPKIRQLIRDGKPDDAEKLADEKFMGRPNRLKPYQMLGDLFIDFDGHENPEVYRRQLDLDSAIARVEYRIGPQRFAREMFCSAAENVLVVRLSCEGDGPGMSGRVRLERAQESETKADGEHSLVMTGTLDGGSGMSFRAALLAQQGDGRCTPAGNALRFENARDLILLLAAASNYRGGDPQAQVSKTLAAGASQSFDQLRDAHVREHQKLYRRVNLKLDTNAGDVESLPTDQRLAKVKSGGQDEQLLATYFNFGRYLLVCSSRPGSMLPANLQGVWNDSFKPAWNSDFHTNINIQMNYWPAEVCNLPECHLPMFDLLDRCRESGRQTARVHYGVNRGFVVHHITDPFGFTTPGDKARAGLWPSGAAWMGRHLWEHWLFGGDEAFLRDKAYPILKEASEFFLDYLVDDGNGHLVTGPSCSPENRYNLPSGVEGRLCFGPTMDNMIVRDLFTATTRASEILKLDEPLRAEIQKAMSRLPETKIGKHGQIMEWLEDYDEPEPGHRHISQCYGLHPSDQISLHKTPELATAARKTIERRLSHGGGQTGWSRGWIVNFWARLLDGDKAHADLVALLQQQTTDGLYDLHPPHIFQIDGNLGGTAGVAEMLLQSHAGFIHLLPALPKAWPSGEVTGLRARGAASVAMNWNNGRMTRATLRFDRPTQCEVRVQDRAQLVKVDAEAGKDYAVEG